MTPTVAKQGLWTILIKMAPSTPQGPATHWTSDITTIAAACAAAGLTAATPAALVVMLPLARVVDPAFPWSIAVDASLKCTFTP